MARAPTPRVLKPLLSALRPYPLQSLLLVGTIVFDAAFDTLIPVVLSLLIDQAASRNLPLALGLGGAMAGGWLLSVGSQLTRDYLYAWLTSTVLTDLRVGIEAHLHQRDYARLRDLRPSDVSGALGSELARIENLLLNVLPSFLFAGLYLVFSLVAMAGTDLRLAGLVLVLVPFALIGPRLLGHRASSSGAASRQQESDLGSSAQEHFQAQPLLRTFDLADRFRAAFRERARQLGLKARRFYLLTNLTRRTPNLTMQLTHLGLMLVGLSLLWQGDLGLGAFLAFNLLFLNISSSVLDLSSTYGGWLAAGLAFARLETFAAPLAVPPLAIVAAAVAEPTEAPVALEFQGVDFAYAPGKALLHDLSFVLEPGKRTALVGPSGSGKSTLAALLSGLYRPQAGRILWNGADVTTLEPAALRSRLGIVFQENTILNASLEDNIRLGTEGDLAAAVREAGLEAWVSDLPQGLATPAGEAGGFLSGGQKQRLALARALYRRPGLLLLDEATSALDPLSESLVNQTLRSLTGTTVVHITHRLEGVRDYDRILVLSKGRVIEAGNHAELLAAGGLYASLWAKQAGVTVSADAQTATLTPGALGALPLFAGCRPETLSALAAQFVSETTEPGQKVIRQGTPGSRFFVVARGRVDVLIASPAGEALVATLEDGDFFGEMSLLASALTSASVVARIPTLLLALEKSTFQALIAEDPVVAQRVRDTALHRQEENRLREAKG